MTHEKIQEYMRHVKTDYDGYEPYDKAIIDLLIEITERLDALEAESKPNTKQIPFMQRVHDHVKDRNGEVLSTIIIAAEMQEDVKRVGKAFSHLREKGLVEWVASNHWRLR